MKAVSLRGGLRSAWVTYGALAAVFAGLFAVRVATDDPRGHVSVGAPVLSADGSTMVFLRWRYTPEDKPRIAIYAKDLSGGRVDLVAQGRPAPARRNVHTWWAPSVRTSPRAPAVSGDGRHVAFTAYDRLVPEDTDDAIDVYVRDLATGALTRASTRAGGAPAGGGHSGGTLALSGDGRLVAFLSEAALDPRDRNRAIDAYVKDLRTGAVALASTMTDGAVLAAGADEGGLALSADGSTLAFATRSPEVGAGRDTGPGSVQIVVKDLRTGVASWVSALSDGGRPREDAAQPALSADGRVVAFISRAPLLPYGTGRPHAAFDVYVREVATGALTWATGTEGAGRLNGVAPAFALSADGATVAMTTHGPGERWPHPGELVVLDLRTKEVTRVDDVPLGGRVAMSGDGSRIGWATRRWLGATVLRDLPGGDVVEPLRRPLPSYWSRLRDAVPGLPDLEPVRRLFP